MGAISTEKRRDFKIPTWRFFLFCLKTDWILGPFFSRQLAKIFFSSTWLSGERTWGSFSSGFSESGLFPTSFTTWKSNRFVIICVSKFKSKMMTLKNVFRGSENAGKGFKTGFKISKKWWKYILEKTYLEALKTPGKASKRDFKISEKLWKCILEKTCLEALKTPGKASKRDFKISENVTQKSHKYSKPWFCPPNPLL